MAKFLDKIGLQHLVDRVKELIDSKVSSTYKAKGSCTFANLPATLTANEEGFVYNISNNFTTDSRFVEGSGNNYPAGTNVVVINLGTEVNPDWKFDVLTGITDLSAYVQKSGDTMTGSLAIGSTLTVGTRASGNTSGTNSVTEGINNIASGAQSYAQGNTNTASGLYAHAEGYQSIANHKSQHVQGEYNVQDTSTAATTARGNYVHIIGNGNDTARSNAYTLDWNGNAWFAGDVYIGPEGAVNKNANSKKLATEEYVQANGGKIDSISINGNTQEIDANKNVDLSVPLITNSTIDIIAGTSDLPENTYYFVYE